MLPFNVPRTYPPSWVDLLRDTVLWPNRRWVPTESVNILLATRELQAWLADPRPYAGKDQKWSWLSVLADFLHSVDQLGPALTTALGSDLSAAVATTGSLKTDFESKTHRDMEAAFPARRSSDQAVIDQLNPRWDEVDVRLAAWRDLIETCRDTTVPYDTLALRRDLFWQMARAGDHDTSQLSDFLAGTLADSAFHVDLAKVWLGDTTDTGTSLRRPDESAGLSVNEQLDFCERLVTQPAIPGHYVVWIAYNHAGPGVIYRKLGPISFWSVKWLRAVLAEGQGPNWEVIPSELKVRDSMFRLDDLPKDDQDMLLARADLGAGAWTDPVRVATEQIELVVTLAGFHVGNTKWRPMAGYFVAIDDRVRGIGSFHPVISRDEFPNHPYQHAMDAELHDLAQQLAPHLPIADGSLSKTIQAVRWWQQARRQSPLAAVLLHVRVVELLAHQIGVEKWYTYLDDYQRASWIRYHLIYELGHVIDDCMHNVDRLPSVADQQWLHELRRTTTTYQPGGAFRRDLGKGFDKLPKLAQLFPPSDDLGRRVQDAVRRYTLQELPRWCNDLERDWQLVRDRVVRVRNALAHGGPLIDDTVVTVHEFIEQLAQWSLEVALEGLLGGQDIATANAAHKQESDQWNDGLASAATVIDALTG
jgi:hypothetical protein